MAVFILPAHQDDGVDEPPFFLFLDFFLFGTIAAGDGRQWAAIILFVYKLVYRRQRLLKKVDRNGAFESRFAPSAFSNVFWFAPIYRGFSFQFPLFFIAVLHGIRIKGTFWKAVALFFARFSYGKNRKMRPIHLPAPEDADVRNRRLF